MKANDSVYLKLKCARISRRFSDKNIFWQVYPAFKSTIEADEK